MEESLDRVLKFGTDKAHYFLHAGVHGEQTQVETEFLDVVDGIMLEPGSEGDLSDWDALSLIHDKQYSQLYKQNLSQENPSTLFFTDINRSYSGLGFGAIGEFLGATADDQKLLKAASLLQLGNIHNNVGLRSAYAAQKAERISQSYFEKKPTVFISYGSSHLDIKQYLQKPSLRKALLKKRGFKCGEDQVFAHEFNELDEDYVRSLHLDDKKIEYQEVTYEL